MEKQTAVFIIFFIFCGIFLIGNINATELLYKKDIVFSGSSSTDFGVEFTSGVSGNEVTYLEHIRIKEVEDFVNVTFIGFETHDNYFENNSKSSYFIESPISYAGDIVGNITHGFSCSVVDDKVFYTVTFHDLDLTGLSGTIDLFVNNTFLDAYYKANYEASAYPTIDKGECYFFEAEYNLGIFGHGTNGGDFNHRYYVIKKTAFLNILTVWDKTGVYEIRLQRENITGYEDADWWNVVTNASKFICYDKHFIYADETDFTTTNYSANAWNDSFCEEVFFSVEDTSNLFYNYTVQNICFIEEYDVTVQGYTKSSKGNLIQNVGIDYDEDIAYDIYSDETGFYKYSLENVGSVAYIANKTGFFNQSDTLIFYKNGTFQHDIIMIPLTELNTGEFGGIVYDYCTKESIGTGVVYLINETSGNESYTYTNQYGFYEFEGLNESLDYTVRAYKSGYEESVVYNFTFDETTKKTQNIWLLPESGCIEDEGLPEITPTPTLTPERETIQDSVDNVFDLIGIKDWSLILALCIIGLMGGVFGKYSNGNPIIIIFGAFFGFIISTYMGLLPTWMLALTIIITIVFIVGVVIKQYGGQ